MRSVLYTCIAKKTAPTNLQCLILWYMYKTRFHAFFGCFEICYGLFFSSPLSVILEASVRHHVGETYSDIRSRRTGCWKGNTVRKYRQSMYIIFVLDNYYATYLKYHLRIYYTGVLVVIPSSVLLLE